MIQIVAGEARIRLWDMVFKALDNVFKTTESSDSCEGNPFISGTPPVSSVPGLEHLEQELTRIHPQAIGQLLFCMLNVGNL